MVSDPDYLLKLLQDNPELARKVAERMGAGPLMQGTRIAAGRAGAIAGSTIGR